MHTVLLVLAVTSVAHAQGASPDAAVTDAEVTDAAVTDAEVTAWYAAVSNFDKLRTADSPAFVVLGVSPTEIQRPTTPRTLVAALGAALSDGNLTVPKNFALEVAPYWLIAHPDLSIRSYRKDHLLRPLRTLSLSVGTTQTPRPATAMTVAQTDADIGFGARTMLVQTGGSDRCSQASDKLLKLLLTAEEKTEIQRWSQEKGYTLGTPEYDAKVNEVVAAREKESPLDTDKCVALATAPLGFQIDLAAAFDVRAAGSKLTTAATSLAGYAIWANASYDTMRFSGIAMARLGSHDVAAMGTARVLDAGVRGIYKAKSYVVSAEALVRYQLTDAPDRTTLKADIGIEYELTSDTWVSLTFGKDFALLPGESGSLFSLTNLKWGFAKSQTGK